jgi:phosphotransferase system  glucose/maltose/N-acetylglucosamine-specific IIC component
MWMMVFRPLVILLGVVFAALSALVTAAISLNPLASNTAAATVFLMMAMQAVIAVGCIVYGVWAPIAHWMEERSARR